jgi:protein-disulfide isomerase
MECTFCIKQHSKWILKEFLKNNSETVNYMFKNFPIPSHKNAQIEAEAAKCVEKIAWWKKYFEYLDWVYSSTQWGWEWYDIKKLTALSQKLWIDVNKFDSCLSKYETKEDVEREFMQWRMLWIESVPASLILNNETWEYSIITKEADFENIDELIRDISK